MEDSLKNEIKRISRLRQFQNTPSEQIEKIAQKNVTLRNLLASGNFIDDQEKDLAKKTFEAYLEKKDFESFSDLQTLSALVYNSVLLNRVQKTLNDEVTKEGKCYISEKLVKSLHEIENQIESLKKSVGINKEDKKDDASYLQLLIKRFQKHIMTMRAEYTCRCGRCGAILLLRQKTKDFDCLLHPNFVGLNYLNLEALQDVEDGKLTTEQYARFFKVSTDFVDYAIKNKGKYLLPEN